ncbi:MAG: DnaA regulatory inactivator Hda [Ectothiorhodospiraceae bacterium]|jgi:DnaA family protein|nr:DnaA regulatory inactivator Hda [Ectothiorhodospiraceae bacterium]
MAEQLALDVGLREGMSFASFLVGDNAAAVETVRLLGTAGGERQVCLWGGAESGKTHLLHAACAEAAAQGLRASYLPLDTLAAHGPALLEGLEQLDLVCLDDVQEVAGDEAWERALFDCINRLRAGHTRLLLAARQAPAGLDIRLPDLASRLVWGPVFQLHTLDDAQKCAALGLRAGLRGFELPREVCEHLLRTHARNLSYLMSVLERLDAASLAAQRRITLPFLRQILSGED